MSSRWTSLCSARLIVECSVLATQCEWQGRIALMRSMHQRALLLSLAAHRPRHGVYCVLVIVARLLRRITQRPLALNLCFHHAARQCRSIIGWLSARQSRASLAPPWAAARVRRPACCLWTRRWLWPYNVVQSGLLGCSGHTCVALVAEGRHRLVRLSQAHTPCRWQCCPLLEPGWAAEAASTSGVPHAPG